MPTNELLAELQFVKDKLAAAEQRLAMAENVAERSRKCLVDFMDGNLVNDIGLMDDLNAFLSTPGSGGWVGVRKNDIRAVLALWEEKSPCHCKDCQGIKDRLRSALAKGGSDGE